VGGAAQIKAMKKIAGPLRIELAQYRELAAFAQFGSDLNKDTLDRLRHGERIVEVFKQPQYQPMPVEQQVLVMYVLTHKYFSKVKVEETSKTERAFLKFVEERNGEILTEIREKREISEELETKIKTVIDEFMNSLEG
jgi:F-type H+-transporting ATPase subunit alpha